MRKKVGCDTLRRENGETKENHDSVQTALDIKTGDPPPEDLAPLNGNHEEGEENSDEAEREIGGEGVNGGDADEEERKEEEEVKEEGGEGDEQMQEQAENQLPNQSSPNPEELIDSGGGEESQPADMTVKAATADPGDKEEATADKSQDPAEETEETDISSDAANVSPPEPETPVSPNPEATAQLDTAEPEEVAGTPESKPSENTQEQEEAYPLEDHPHFKEDNYRTNRGDSPSPRPSHDEGHDEGNGLEDGPLEEGMGDDDGEDLEPPQQPVRPHHQGMMGQGGMSPRQERDRELHDRDMHDHDMRDHEMQDHDMQPQNLHQSPHHQPQNLHQSPQNLHQSPVQMSPANMHQSPAYSGPLNLHQSPAHPGPSPTLSEHSPHPFQRPSPYHPPSDSGPHNPHLQYSMSSQYPSAAAYNHHYFNNANNNYNGQHAFMAGHGFPANFGSGEGGRGPGMAEPHDMYPHQPRAHESHHSSQLGHPALSQFPGRQGDPYSFGGPPSDDDGCSPNRGSGPPFNPMGFHGMPMPLIAPKPKKPRKPRKPKSPRPLPEPAVLAMQMNREDSRSGDFSDMSFDDDGDGDGKLVIAEGDDLDIKMEGLGEDGKPQKKPRRKHNRFNGMSEEDVMKRLLPDLICPDLDILIVGINPGLYAAFKQHHYAGPGNHFWKCLFLSGLIPRPMNADNDRELISLGIGFTNIVERTTRASQELTRQEIEEGAKKLIAKIKEFNPKIAVFNGKGIYEVFSGQKEFIFGKQPEKIEGTETYAWVMPNSSARCAQLPRAVDKVPFYAALKKYRDYLRGSIAELDESEVVFPEVKLQNFNNKRIKKEEYSDDMNGSLDGEERVDPDTGKKRRGRPPKPRPDGTMPAPKRRRVDEFGNPLPKGSNPIDPVTGKKKRGRPKKCDMPPQPPMGDNRPMGLPNGLQAMALKAKAAEAFRGEALEGEVGPGGNSSKTPTRLPPFSPHFALGGPLRTKEEEADEGEEGPQRLHPPMEGEEPAHGPRPPTHDPRPTAHDLSRADSLPDLSGRLGDDPCSPPPSPMGKSLPPPEFEPPRSLHEEETNHSTEDRRPDSARSMTRPHVPCNFSAPTTPVDHSPHQGYPPQQRYSPFSRGAPHHSPNYPPQGPPHPQGPQNFHAPYRGTPHLQGTPPHQQYDSPGPQHPPKSHHPSDLSTKSLTGLESLVDQIPAIAEADSGVFSSSGNGSHPATPRSVGPYSPGQYHGQYGPPPTYSGPYPGPGGAPPGTPGSDSFPTDLSTSTNYGHPASTTASHSPSTPSNFSVSHLAHSSVRGSGEENGDATITGHAGSSHAGPGPPMTEAFSVSSLASSYASPVSSHGTGGPEEPPKYPPGISSNPYMSGHSSMFSPSLMTRSIGPPGGSFPSMGGMAGMAGMGAAAFAGMAGYQAMAGYGGQYSAASAAAGAYTGAAQAFAAAAGGGTYHHGLPMPNPSYPYPSPYSQSPYTQSPYF